MNLYAILSWYDEPPTWLAGCVASLTRIGVDHIIAVDGRYPHFNIGAPARSRLEQVDAITSTAHGAGMGLTVFQPTQPLLETDKRTLAFQLLNASATPFKDWVTVIDADEFISEGTHHARIDLAAIPTHVHTVRGRVTGSVDPFADPEPDNDISTKTLELHHKLPVPSEFASMQSRFFRVLTDMRCVTSHYDYTGTDESGKRIWLRPDIGTKPQGTKPTEVGTLETTVTFQHRKNHRTYERREHKKAYYDLRNSLRIER